MVFIKRLNTVDGAPNLLVAIDPGASWHSTKSPYVGVAKFQWGTLVDVGVTIAPTAQKRKTIPPAALPNALVRKVCKDFCFAQHKDDLGESVDVLAVEQPIIYKHGAARPQDILALRTIYGAFIGAIDADFYSNPTPETWKGSEEGKETVNERTLKVLNLLERTVLLTKEKALTDHAIDAIGIGLWVLGRMDKGGVVA